MIFDFAPEAIGDIERLREFLDEVSPSAAIRATDRILSAIRSLDRFPGRGRPASVEGLRELVVPFGGAAYLVRYFHDEPAGRIVVIRIWHGRENGPAARI